MSHFTNDGDVPAPAIIVMPLTASQINVSSVGDTYIDVSGNTYAETINQTRTTMPSYIRTIGWSISGHVSAGTGSFQIWDQTSSTQIGVVTTTSTNEAHMTSGSAATVANDLATLRVKNSGAGNTVTIDAGGFITYDSSYTLSGNAPGYFTITGTGGGGWYSRMSVVLLKSSTGATTTMQFQNGLVSTTIASPGNNIGSSFGTSQSNTVFTIIPDVKAYTGTSTAIQLNASALSGWFACGVSWELKNDLV